ncbi:DUF4184 family protein [Geodermatophilus sabuli]|uniref:DUF4184 family protein n=1 Tax=Geodermatophilus sabuli TaxID=1564158 RepID=A0A285E8U0_9ACTN|nr:DUF4184 family protein [Geodermatophilus sabuli]MBB3085053.1 hypothetical protein [Geodermatophilus sabuli]SNX95539.1 protein of unknown function [Geodermatophilus sabuli]
MPFTPSHAAAVLPFLRTPLPASALVIGSMSPDLPFYLPVPVPVPTHTALAVVTVDVALGALAWTVWHGLLAPPAVACAPSAVRARLTGLRLGLRPRTATVPAVVWTLLALAVGAATHVLWDEFTHARRWGPTLLPVLADQWGLLPGYRWLQYLGGLVGGLVLLAWLARWWRRTPARPAAARPAARWVWALLVVVGVATGGAAALTAPSPGSAAFVGATWGGGSALAVAVALAAGWHARHRAAGDQPVR